MIDPNRIPAWLRGAQPPSDPQAQAGGYGYQGPPPRVPKWINTLANMNGRNYGANGKNQAGYYQTGDNERRDDIYIGGQQIRMAPNSYIVPKGRQLPSQTPSYVASVRG